MVPKTYGSNVSNKSMAYARKRIMVKNAKGNANCGFGTLEIYADKPPGILPL